MASNYTYSITCPKWEIENDTIGKLSYGVDYNLGKTTDLISDIKKYTCKAARKYGTDDNDNDSIELQISKQMIERILEISKVFQDHGSASSVKIPNQGLYKINLITLDNEVEITHHDWCEITDTGCSFILKVKGELDDYYLDFTIDELRELYG